MRRLRGGEGGFSIVPTIATLGLLLTLGGVAVQEAVNALGHTRENEMRKRALQSADAAIEAAAFMLNRADLGGGINIDPLDPGAVAQQTCLVGTGTVAGVDLAQMPVGTPADPEGRRWCPQTAPEVTPEGSAWTFRVSELARLGAESCAGTGLLALDREIVAVGTAGKAVRRVRARLRASVALLSGAAVQAASDEARLEMTGTARVLGDVASNHDIVATATNVIAGSAVPGPGRSVSGGVLPAGTRSPACSKFVLPAVDPGDSATTNDNTAIQADCITAGIAVTPCKPLVSPHTGGVHSPASPSFAGSGPDKPVLHVWGNGRATLTGATYSFCSIRLESQGALLVRAAVPITRIFLRDPAECEGVPGAGQIVVDGGARIINCHGQAQPESLQLYAVGNDAIPTTQILAGAGLLTPVGAATACGADPGLAGWPMVVYAPRSRVELGGSTALAGQVAADAVAMSGSAAVQPVNALVNLDQLGGRPVLPLYQPIDYVECTGLTFDRLPSEAPSQGC